MSLRGLRNVKCKKELLLVSERKTILQYSRSSRRAIVHPEAEKCWLKKVCPPEIKPNAPSYFFLQVAVLVGLHTILCHRKFCGASPFRGRCVWTPFPTCSSPCHLFLTVYPKETKACWTRRGILKCPFCVSEEFRELGGETQTSAHWTLGFICVHVRSYKGDNYDDEWNRLEGEKNGVRLSSGLDSIFLPRIEIPRRFFGIITWEAVFS